jgi:hypothetical protein
MITICRATNLLLAVAFAVTTMMIGSDSAWTQRVERSVASVPNHTVEVTGIGETVELSRRDATRQAIQQVAGTIVDTKRRVELSITDDKLVEIVKENILSYSNAFIQRFEDISVTKRDGFIYVQARVTVEAKPLIERLQEVRLPIKPASTVTVDTTSFTQKLESQDRERKGSTELIQNLVASKSDFFDVKLIGSPELAEIPDTKQPLHKWVKLKVQLTWKPEIAKEWEAAFASVAEERFEQRFHINQCAQDPRRCGSDGRPGWARQNQHNLDSDPSAPFDESNSFRNAAFAIRKKRGQLGHGRTPDQFVCFYGAYSNPIQATCYYRQQGVTERISSIFNWHGAKYKIVLHGESENQPSEVEWRAGRYPEFGCQGKPFEEMAAYLGNSNIYIDGCRFPQSWLGALLTEDVLVLPKGAGSITLNLYVRMQREDAKVLRTISLVKRW